MRASWRAPRYASTTRSSRRTSSGRALRDHAAVVHHDHAVARAHHEVEVVLDDQERDAVALAQRRGCARAARTRSDGLTPAIGSSSSRMRGSVISARTRSSSLRCPPESVPASASAWPSRRTSSSSSRARAPAPPARGARPARASRRAARPDAAARRARRSRARSSASAPAASGRCGRARPARSGAPGGGRSACRRAATRPACGRRKPEMQLKSVDLPAPFGPIRPVIEPGSTSSVAPSTARTPPKLRTHVLDGERRAHSSTISSRRPRIPCGRSTTSTMIARPITIRRT